MQRLFVALRPPPPMRATLAQAMHGVAAARWQSDEQLHLTLAFIGEVDRVRAERIDDALAGVRARSLALSVNGVGAFHSGERIQTLWARAEPGDGLAALAAKVERALHRAGFVIERRRFVPHITLARLNRSSGPSDKWLAANAGLAHPAEQVTSFGLYESRLGAGGASYQRLARYPLV